MEEIWKDISGYKGLYQISNLGRVKSMERYIRRKTKNGITYTNQYVTEKIRFGWVTKQGRQAIRLWDHGKSKIISISRTVITLFKSSLPFEKAVCMHLDHNPLNNNVDNLEWGTQADNMQMDWRDGRRTAYSHWTGKINKNHPLSKPVVQLDLKGNFIKNWPNSKEVERQTKIPSRGVRKCCTGEIKKHKGFIFKYESDFNKTITQQKLF
jgi:hypothetical protein